MLEKKANDMHVSKLRAMLLLEADFNAANKILFKSRMTPTLEKGNLIPREIIGGRQFQSAMHVAVDKRLVSYIANQAKTSHVIISADASNCFDRVAHSIVALACSHFGLSDQCVETFFTTM